VSAELDIQEVYRRYGPLVLRRAERFLNREDAEEVVHDAFMKLIESPMRFRGDSTPATWLYQVATRLCIDRLRRRARFSRLIEVHRDVIEGFDPGEHAEARVFLQALWERIDHELLYIGVLYYLDGLTTADIGKALSVSDRTIANRLISLGQSARAALPAEPAQVRPLVPRSERR
jgi:RNA polymerase sigma-70 factor (ECF subfamily)